MGVSPAERREGRVGHQGEPVFACGGPACVQSGARGQKEEVASHLAGSDGGREDPPPLLEDLSSLPVLQACISSALSLPPSPIPLPFAPLLAAPPVKAKRKQSEEGDPLDPSVSPQPDAEQSRSQSPVHLEVSWATPGEPPPCPPPSPVHSFPGELGDSPSSQEGVFPTSSLQSQERDPALRFRARIRRCGSWEPGTGGPARHPWEGFQT